MAQQTDIHLGKRVIRDDDNTPGTITARDGDRYTIQWDDNSKGFVTAAAMDAALLEEHDRFSARHKRPGNIHDRAREAKASLDAIRDGTSGRTANEIISGLNKKPSAADDLSDADRANILARIDAGAKKVAAPAAQSAPQKPNDQEFADTVSKHVRTLLGADDKKPAAPVSPPATQKPASAQATGNDEAFSDEIAKHVRALLQAKS